MSLLVISRILENLDEYFLRVLLLRVCVMVQSL